MGACSQPYPAFYPRPSCPPLPARLRGHPPSAGNTPSTHTGRRTAPDAHPLFLRHAPVACNPMNTATFPDHSLEAVLKLLAILKSCNFRDRLNIGLTHQAIPAFCIPHVGQPGYPPSANAAGQRKPIAPPNRWSRAPCQAVSLVQAWLKRSPDSPVPFPDGLVKPNANSI